MKVLIIEDDPIAIETIAVCFELRWPEVEVITADRGEDGIKLALTQNPEIVVLDVGLPGMDGFQTLKDLRQFSDASVIMLTARDSEVDKVKALEYGADDFVTKPFSHIELIARVRAVQRRAGRHKAEEPAGIYCNEEAGLEIDMDARTVRRFGKPINLAPLEYSLLNLLVQNEGRVLTHEKIMGQVWGQEYINDVDYLKVYVRRLRNKIGDDAQNTELIHTERGVGYIFQVRPKRGNALLEAALLAA